MITISVTGHRPAKLGGYSPTAQSRLIAFANHLVREIVPARFEVSQYITGMALGWDMAIAEACVANNIPFIAAVPCEGQSNIWPAASQAQWTRLINHAARVEILAPAYSPTCMNDRNRWMVDHSDRVVALWNGTPGGTANCVNYAISINRPYNNAWPSWQRFSSL